MKTYDATYITVKIIDFGLSKKFEKNSLQNTPLFQRISQLIAGTAYTSGKFNKDKVNCLSFGMIFSFQDKPMNAYGFLE